MKAQTWVSDRQSAQRAIDLIKEAYASGKPHVVVIQPPMKQASNAQRIKAMTMVSLIAAESGEQDVERVKYTLLNTMGWFPALVEERAPVPLGLTVLSKEQTAYFIDLLDNFAAEQGYIIHSA